MRWRGAVARVASFACAGSLACGGGVTDTPRVGSVELTPAVASVRTGNTLPLSAQVKDPSGRPISVGTIFWSSSDTAIAVVSPSGIVTARRAGTVTVAASTAGLSGLASVTVSDRDVASVQLLPAAMFIRVGATGVLEARTLDSQGGALTGRPIVWTTSNSQVATVDATGIVTARAAGTATITATSEGRSGSAVITVTSVPVTAVSLTPSIDTLNAGETVQLTVVTRDAGGAVLTGRTVTWSAADTRVVTVSSSGLVSAIAPGTTTVVATSEGRTATSTLVVLARPVASVNVTPPSSTVIVGDVLPLAAQLTDGQGTVLSGRVVTWTSSNPSVASVDGTGRVTAVAPGNVIVTATSEVRSGTATVRVNAVPVSAVQVTPPSADISTGGMVQLTATARSSSGTVLTGRAVTWRSGAPGVATVTASGLVTGAGAGTAVVIAEVEGVTGSSTITVRIPRVASISITPSTATISPAGNVQLVATLRDEAGNTLTGRVITWRSSDEAVAFVTSNGGVIGFLPGTVTITATAEGVSGTARVTVR